MISRSINTLLVFSFQDALHKLNWEQLFSHLSQSSNSLKDWIVVKLLTEIAKLGIHETYAGNHD